MYCPACRVLMQADKLCTGQEKPATVDDLAMLVRRLVHELKNHSINNELQTKAMDYLRRKGLQSSPLRG